MTPHANQFLPLIKPLHALPERKKALKSAVKAARNGTEEGYDNLAAAAEAVDEITAPLEEAISSAMSLALEAASAGEALKPASCAGPVIFDEVWKQLYRNGWGKLPGYRQNDLCEALSKTLVAATEAVRINQGDDAAAKALAGWISSGSIPLTCGQNDLFTNHSDGSQAFIVMENWAPRLVARDKDGEAKPLAPMPDGLAFQQQIHFPSGNLLISDTIGLTAVGKSLVNLRESGGIMMNYARHRIAYSAACASLLNIVDIQTGSDGPSMVKGDADDILFAGSRGGRFDVVAPVCHEYWGSRIIDREVAVDLAIAAGASREDAEAEIAQWLASSKFANEVSVPPGTYNLYWDDDRETLGSMLRDAEIAAPEDTRFVLSRTPLNIPETEKRLRRFHLMN